MLARFLLVLFLWSMAAFSMAAGIPISNPAALEDVQQIVSTLGIDQGVQNALRRDLENNNRTKPEMYFDQEIYMRPFTVDAINVHITTVLAKYISHDYAQKLLKEKALSPREYDEAQATYAQLKAEIDTANINLGYTKVTAPISGVTSKEGLSEGSLITADTSLLTRLTQMDPLYVNFAAPDAENMKQRQDVANGKLSLPGDGTLKAEIRFGDGSVYNHEGTINFTDSLIDEQTGTIRTRAIVPNPENTLLPGQFVRVIVKGFVRKNTIAIPDQAILQGPQGMFVYVVDGAGKAAIKPVTPGDLSDGMRIIESGLAVGDVVITENMIKVRPGAPVKLPEPAPAEAAATAAATEAPSENSDKKAE